MMAPSLSVIIPAFNEQGYIERLIASIQRAIQARAEARPDAGPVELIVVDNASTDATAAIATRLGARVITESRRCIAAARNAGARAARGELLVFVDADNVVSDNLLSAIDAAMQTGAYVGGGVRVVPERRSLGIRVTEIYFNLLGALLGVSAGVIYTTRMRFEAIGGFDDTLYAGEDARFVLELRRAARRDGLRFLNLKSAHIVTSTRKFDRLGDWMLLEFMARFVLRGFRGLRDRRFCDSIWYDPRTRGPRL
jgi:glycosyltransferase involved in cell wall biosynthesis